MSQWTPCKRRDFIRRLRKIGFDGPYSGTRHQFMILGQHRLAIPSNTEFSVPQLRMMLREVQQIIGRDIDLDIFWLRDKSLEESDNLPDPDVLVQEFVQCYNPENRHQRTPTWFDKNPDGRWRAYDYEELINRDKASLDIFWLRDESLEESDNLPDPDVLAQEIVEDLEAALEQFREIAADLGGESK